MSGVELEKQPIYVMALSEGPAVVKRESNESSVSIEAARGTGLDPNVDGILALGAPALGSMQGGGMLRVRARSGSVNESRSTFK